MDSIISLLEKAKKFSLWTIMLLIIVFFLSFYLYYTLGYKIFSDLHQKNLWSATHFNDSAERLNIRIIVPKSIGDFVDGEILIQAWNNDTTDKELKLILNAVVYDEHSDKINASFCSPTPLKHPFVYISTESSFDRKKNNSAGNSSVALTVPAYGSANTSLWMTMQPDLKIDEKSCVVIQVLTIVPLGENAQECYVGVDSMMCPVEFDNFPEGKIVVRFDRSSALYDYAFSYLLSPPWSNVFLLTIIVLIVWQIEAFINRTDATINSKG